MQCGLEEGFLAGPIRQRHRFESGTRYHARLAQRQGHLPYKQETSGSSPLPGTEYKANREG